MIGEKFWQSLSDDHKALFKKAQKASREEITRILPEQQKEFIAKMKEAGIAITYPDKAPFIAATQKVRDKLGIKYWGEDIYKKIVAIGKKDL